MISKNLLESRYKRKIKLKRVLATVLRYMKGIVACMKRVSIGPDIFFGFRHTTLPQWRKPGTDQNMQRAQKVASQNFKPGTR